MASKIFLLAIVLAAVAISKCHPKAGKRSSNYGMNNNGQSGELNIGTYLTSKSAQAGQKSIDSDSSSSESREYVPPQFGSQARHNNQHVYSLRRKMEQNYSNQQGQWQNSDQQQQWDNLQTQGQQQHSGEYQQQNFAEYQQQGQSQGQGYGGHGSKQYQGQNQQSSEESFSQQQGQGNNQQKQYKNQQKQYQNQKQYGMERGNIWQNGASWKNANPESSEESPQKYNFPRQAGQQQASSDESASSEERRLHQGDWQWNRLDQQGQHQLMYARGYKQMQLAVQQQSNKQNDQSGLNSSQQQNSDESIDIQKANKVIVKHDSDELQGRTVANQQAKRITSASSEEMSSKEATSGGRINRIYRNYDPI